MARTEKDTISTIDIFSLGQYFFQLGQYFFPLGQYFFSHWVSIFSHQVNIFFHWVNIFFLGQYFFPTRSIFFPLGQYFLPPDQYFSTGSIYFPTRSIFFSTGSIYFFIDNFSSLDLTWPRSRWPVRAVPSKGSTSAFTTCHVTSTLPQLGSRRLGPSLGTKVSQYEISGHSSRGVKLSQIVPGGQ